MGKSHVKSEGPINTRLLWQHTLCVITKKATRLLFVRCIATHCRYHLFTVQPNASHHNAYIEGCGALLS